MVKEDGCGKMRLYHYIMCVSLWWLVPKESMALSVGSSSSSQTCHPTSSSVQNGVQVWDGVVTKKVCEELHQLDMEDQQQRRQQPHFLLQRPLPQTNDDEQESYTLVERVLDGILTELGDDSTFVEYWSRTEWKHLEAHVDIDEYLAKEFPSNEFQYPQNGHVLYVQVGHEVRGPTCIIDSTDITTVPAVQGRLTRFVGTAWHAVPRPTDRWTIPFVKGAPKHTPTTQYGRHVILFNTWNNPPHNIHPISTHDTDNKIPFNNNNNNANSMMVSPYSTWKSSTPIQHNTNNENDWGTAKIWLLGNEQRRKHPMRTIPLQMPLETLDTALHDPSNVHIVPYQSSQPTPFEENQ